MVRSKSEVLAGEERSTAFGTDLQPGEGAAPERDGELHVAAHPLTISR